MQSTTENEVTTVQPDRYNKLYNRQWKRKQYKGRKMKGMNTENYLKESLEGKEKNIKEICKMPNRMSV